jgi:hypothetical protein
MATDIVTNPDQSFASLVNYKSYVALLDFDPGTNAFTATVLNSNDANYLGDIVWSKVDVGHYKGVRAGAFTVNKTHATITNSKDCDRGFVININWEFPTDQIDVYTGYASDNSPDDYTLNRTPVVINVYS